MSGLLRNIRNWWPLKKPIYAIDAAEFSHIGGRTENQDACRVFSDSNAGEYLIVVADGLGGQGNGGGLAARTAIDTAEAIWASRAEQSTLDLLHSLVARAHEAVLQAAADAGVEAQTTLAALYIGPRAVVSVHAGDSRVSQFGRTGFVRRTLDHSMAQIQVLSGKLEESEMARSPDRNHLITSIGEPEKPDHEITEWSLREGRQFVVCSDGFWEIFSPDEQAALVNESDLQGALESAIQAKLAVAADGHDNTTAVLLRVRKPPARQRAFLGAALLLAGGIGAAFIGLGSPVGGPPADAGPAAPSAKTSQTDAPDRETSGPKEPRPARERPPRPGTLNISDADIAVESASEAASRLTDRLRVEGLLGDKDILVHEPEHGGNSGPIERYEQRHDGIPVEDGQVIVSIQGGRIVNIIGRVQPDIALQTLPLLEFDKALTAAANSAGEAVVNPLGDETPRIARVEAGTHVRVWRVDVEVGTTLRPERWLIDAHSGAIVHRTPLIAETADG